MESLFTIFQNDPQNIGKNQEPIDFINNLIKLYNFYGTIKFKNDQTKNFFVKKFHSTKINKIVVKIKKF